MTNRLANIKNFDQLIRYIEDELDWPCQEYGFDEITFKYTPEELGIKDEDSVQIKQIHQLRPFYQGQPWGIFFIEFEKKRLPVALLRRVLSHLVVKKRASANSADKAVWNMDNLLFISAFGNESNDTREIAFAHFHQEDGDLPTLKVLGWDGADTVLKMEFVDQELHEKLHWPKDPKNVEAWQSTWSSAFRHKPGFVIKTANALADRLAELARGIRGAAETLMAHESEKGPLRKLYKAFQMALIYDLTEADFADTYAQTITYGLLTAAISRTDMSGGIYGTALVASNVTDLIPITNPFLKEMLETFIHAGDHKGGIQFDELGIQDVVDLLRGEETDLPAVLRDFDNKTPGEDPVIQFYEHFLSAYNKKLKVQRGVFYTPKPVVSYIVRSVHELLKTEFGLEDGLADTTTWGEMEKKIPGLKRPESSDPDSPFVMILDPATGTATFLVEVINVIFKTLTDKWEKQHLNKGAQIEAWNEYVPKHLLPRIYGFELMMAPYAIAHMKIGLKLFETGYRFSSVERVRVFLTNTLEPPIDKFKQQAFSELSPALANESLIVNSIKEKCVFTVVIGNPPYSVLSGNLTEASRRIVDPYRYVNGKKIVERSMLRLEMHLQDDYIKFLAFGQGVLRRAGVGLLGMITNNGYLDNLTLRGVRFTLIDQFDKIRILNLHGSHKRQNKGKNFIEDENVFDIEQGVCISICSLLLPMKNEPKIKYSEIFATRENKYIFLSCNSSYTTESDFIYPESPNYFFVPWNKGFWSEYEIYIPLVEAMPINISGIVTAHDDLVIDFTDEKIVNNINTLRDVNLSDEEVRKRLKIKDNSGWKLSKARNEIFKVKNDQNYLKSYNYRPFDVRRIYYHSSLVWSDRKKVMRNILAGNNIALATVRQLSQIPWSHIFVSEYLQDDCFISNRTRERSYHFPLFILHSSLESSAQLGFYQEENKFTPNFSDRFLDSFRSLFSSPENGFSISESAAYELFGYIYSILHSINYQNRYGEFLKIDFPRIPITSDKVFFQKLSSLGNELISIHLLRSPILRNSKSIFHGGINRIAIGYPKFDEGFIYINSEEGFEGISKEVWNYSVGSYQICEKWLKDRRGRQLSEEDITHYQKIIVALKETIRIMGEIDQVIEDHGGWPIK